jgi:hypothetical protein
MTAVEFLVEQLAKNGILHSSDIAKAKEMEKQQIVEAHGNKQRTLKQSRTQSANLWSILTRVRCTTTINLKTRTNEQRRI